jgi:hypothetical protein
MEERVPSGKRKRGKPRVIPEAGNGTGEQTNPPGKRNRGRPRVKPEAGNGTEEQEKPPVERQRPRVKLEAGTAKLVSLRETARTKGKPGSPG